MGSRHPPHIPDRYCPGAAQASSSFPRVFLRSDLPTVTAEGREMSERNLVSPVVMRMQGLWPRDVAGYERHRTRRGGDLGHVDPSRSGLNRRLIGKKAWAQEAWNEIGEMRREPRPRARATQEAPTQGGDAPAHRRGATGSLAGDAARPGARDRPDGQPAVVRGRPDRVPGRERPDPRGGVRGARDRLAETPFRGGLRACPRRPGRGGPSRPRRDPAARDHEGRAAHAAALGACHDPRLRGRAGGCRRPVLRDRPDTRRAAQAGDPGCARAEPETPRG